MSDAKGPYKIGRPEEYEGTQDYISPRLVGPGLGRWGAPEISDLMGTEKDLEALVDLVNAAYAEGRKSMEKDFKELLDNTGFLATILQVSILRRGPEVDGEGL